MGSNAPFFCSIADPAPHKWIPAPCSCAALWFLRGTGAFQRPTLMQHRGSSAALVDASTPFLSSSKVPMRQRWIPELHSYAVSLVAASLFHRFYAASVFQRAILTQHRGSSAAFADSIAPFYATQAAPPWWIPASHSAVYVRGHTARHWAMPLSGGRIS